MAGCHNSPRGAFLLLLLLSLLPVPPPPLRRRSCYACIGGQFLKVEISSSHCINDERSQPAKRWKPHAALYMGCRRRTCAPPLQHGVSMRESAHSPLPPPPQGHSRYDEDHSRKEWKVFCIYVILYFMPLMGKHVP